MKNQLINYLIRRQLSVFSDLRPFLANQPKTKTFWHFHGSDQFKQMTFRNEKCNQNSSEDTKLRKQLSDSIIKKKCHLSDIVLKDSNLETKLYVLDTLSIIHGTDNKTTIQFFDSLRPQIIFELENQNIFVLIQLLYLSSVIYTENKSDYNFLIIKIRDKIEDLFTDRQFIYSVLCAEDIAVLCHSLFRLKIKLKSALSRQLIADLVCDPIAGDRLNKSHVLSIVKYLRIIELNDERVIRAISVFIQNNSSKLSFPECAHYLAFYANLSLYDKNIFNLLTDKCEQWLTDEKRRLRSKDLSRFLWSVSEVSHKMSETVIDLIAKRIETNISVDFTDYPHFLIDCFKSLVILGEYRSQLFLKVFDSKQWPKLISSSERNKVAKDLYFILESIAIEKPDIKLKQKFLIYSFAKEVKQNSSQELKERTDLSKYMKIIGDYAIANRIKSRAQLAYPLPHIGIASILFDSMCFEAIDSSVLTIGWDGRQLNGLMTTKIRQMHRKDIKHFLIYDSSDLERYLTSHLTIV